MVEDVRIQEQLDLFQDDFDGAEKDWEEKEQLVYIHEVRFSDNFKDGLLRVIFDVHGAEECNEMLDTPVMFRITNDSKIIRYLTKFCKKIGFMGTFKMATLQQDMKSLEKTVFTANVKLSQGDDRVFVNVFPIAVADGSESSEGAGSGSETPF